MVKTMSIQELSTVAYVIEVNDNTLIVETNNRRKQAKKATSCMVSPQVGDKVSLLFDQDDTYILHVLESTHIPLIQENELQLDVKTINLKANLFNFDIDSITSKIQSLSAFIKTIDLSSIISKLSSQEIHTTSQTKKEFTQFRSNHYDTLDTVINSVEKTQSNISKKEINIEHKNVGSLFTKATGQIKFDAENINLG